jgi:hypothetical protein
VQQVHLNDLVSSLSSNAFVSQCVKIYDRFASYGFTPDSALVVQMAEQCHKSSDVALVLNTKQSSNLTMSPLSYEQLLSACIKQTPFDMPLFNNVLSTMASDGIKLSATGFDSLFMLCKNAKLFEAVQRLWSYAVDVNGGSPHFSWIVLCAQTAAKARPQPARQTFARSLLAAALKADDQTAWPPLLNALFQICHSTGGPHNFVLDVLRDCCRGDSISSRQLMHPELQASLAEALRARLSEPMNEADWKVLSDHMRRLSFEHHKLIIDRIIQLSAADKNDVAVPYSAVIAAIKIFSKYTVWPRHLKQSLIGDEQKFRASFFKMLNAATSASDGKSRCKTLGMEKSYIDLPPTDWAELCLLAFESKNFALLNAIFKRHDIAWKSVPAPLVKQLLTRAESASPAAFKNKAHAVNVLHGAAGGTV